MKLSPLLIAWNRTVRRAPDSPAVIEAATGRVLSRGELDAWAESWRRTYGLDLRGKTVVFAEPNGLAWFQLFLGLLKAGATVVALDPGEPLEAQRLSATAIRASFLWNDSRLEPLPSAKNAPVGCRLIKLTSGSTGKPRGLAFTDSQLIADGQQVCKGMGITPRDLNFALIPLGHSYGLGNLVIPLLIQGTALVCGSAPLPHAIATDLARWKPTVFPAVPALIGAIAGSAVVPAALQSLRLVISAGAMLPAELAGQFQERFRLKVHNFYGSSETGGIAFDRTGDAASTGRSVGTPLPGVHVSGARGQRFTVVSKAVFTLGNRLRHGSLGACRPMDLGELDGAGELVLRGRVKSFVKIAGRRLNLAEVERAMRLLPGVHDAFVMQHTERRDQLMAAVASGRPGEALRVELRAKLAPWKIPRRIIVLQEFPLNARGKTDVPTLVERLRAAR